MDAERRYALLIEPLLGQAAAYARAILRDRENARDAIQEAALRGLERFRTFDTSRPFKGWWFAIVRNCCIDILRRLAAAKTETLDEFRLPHPPGPDTADWEILGAAIESLSEQHREILRLRYFADLSYRELAEALGIAGGTVMSRLHLARKALQAQMGEDES
ncbi:MAG TPA: sigma-70 family RNA polymerase sigma factor [Steroidobacteraceae bacterium]